MSRFVFLSLIFMALAFYELSGGDSFDPEAEGALRQAARGADSAPPNADQPTPEVARQTVDNSLSVPATDRAVSAPKPVPQRERFAQMPLPRFEVARLPLVRATDVPVQVSVANPQPSAGPATLTDDATSADIVAAIAAEVVAERQAGFDPQRRQVIDAVPEVDLRQVIVSRANMRNGPGTRYNVLLSLPRGTAVKVLQDPSTGWLKLQVRDGVAEAGRIGWISAKLLSAKVTPPETAPPADSAEIASAN